jgi:hypothetical protein
VSRDDIPSQFRAVATGGWTQDTDGALLLGALHRSYSGRRSLFTDVTSYEAAVNGRGVPDMDLPDHGPRRVDMLIRRSYSFACEALSQLSRIPEPPLVTAFISIAKTWTEDPVFVGTVTFWARHEGENPYFEVSDTDPDNATMSLELADCDVRGPASA